jgi:hypothetical protein
MHRVQVNLSIAAAFPRRGAPAPRGTLKALRAAVHRDFGQLPVVHSIGTSTAATSNAPFRPPGGRVAYGYLKLTLWKLAPESTDKLKTVPSPLAPPKYVVP